MPHFKICLSYFTTTPFKRIFHYKSVFRLQVLHNGEYGTVCDDGWDLLDANVVCNMLNLGNASRAVIRAGFGSGANKIWLDEVQCFGKL